jgi:hypothetical protein
VHTPAHQLREQRFHAGAAGLRGCGPDRCDGDGEPAQRHQCEWRQQQRNRSRGDHDGESTSHAHYAERGDEEEAQSVVGSRYEKAARWTTCSAAPCISVIVTSVPSDLIAARRVDRGAGAASVSRSFGVGPGGDRPFLAGTKS